VSDVLSATIQPRDFTLVQPEWKIWAITDWQNDETPHWSVAYVEADTAESAMETLAILVADEKRRPDTVYDGTVTDRATWRTVEVLRPFTFILGGYCR
jgi:hypothetical protein